MADTEHQSFRFLDLPSELRLMVYEMLPVKITRHEFVQQSDLPQYFALIDFAAPVAILATCRQIYEEADAILSSKLQQLQSSETHCAIPRLEAGGLALDMITMNDGILQAICDWYNALKDNINADFQSCMTDKGYDFQKSLVARGFVDRSGTESIEQSAQRLSTFIRKSGRALSVSKFSFIDGNGEIKKHLVMIELALVVPPMSNNDYLSRARRFLESFKRFGRDEELLVRLNCIARGTCCQALKDILFSPFERWVFHVNQLWSTGGSGYLSTHNDRVYVSHTIDEYEEELAYKIGWQSREWI